ncbi:MAG: hypothetical protein Q4F06_03930 [Eubacteriales bacterium]|nr:hypothetical protein [Eubacteriales bacterium]
MVGLALSLGGEIAFEAIRFVIMLLLLVLAVFVGGKIRKVLDARKASKLAVEESETDITE